MRRCVRADETGLPAGRRSLRIASFGRAPVVLPLVAQELTIPRLARAPIDGPGPIVMPALVPKMSEQRAIRFVHLTTSHLAFDLIRLRDVDGDETLIVSCQHLVVRRTAGRDG